MFKKNSNSPKYFKPSNLLAMLLVLFPLLMMPIIFFSILRQLPLPAANQAELINNEIQHNQITSCLSNLERMNSVQESNYFLIKQSNDCLKKFDTVLQDNLAYQSLLAIENILASEISFSKNRAIKTEIISQQKTLKKYLKSKYPIYLKVHIYVGTGILSLFWLGMFSILLIPIAEIINPIFINALNKSE